MGTLAEKLKDVPELNIEEALAVVGGSEQAYERIISVSVRLLPENMARLAELIGGDLSKYAIEIHGVKGVLNNLGAYALGSKAFALETAAKAGDRAACGELHQPFLAELSRFCEEVQGRIGQMENGQKSQGDPAQLRQLLPELREAAEFFDSARALELMADLEGYSYGQELDQLLLDLRDAFEGFDFEAAELCLEGLLCAC